MNRISDFRKKRDPKITQLELALKIGFKKARLANYEQLTRYPNITDCKKIVLGLNELGVQCGLDDVFPIAEPAANDGIVPPKDAA